MNAPSHYILATAGHVDHGKTALVKALTGIDPDRLPEEKARGITIELGFAHLALPGTGPLPSSLQIGVVDVPGHEDFVRNMVTGVGSIDLVLLVVAADDGWMPQTEEHFQILTYLGIKRGVVALTKSDLTPARIESAIDSVREHLTNTPLADAPIVPTSILTGGGLRELKEALERVLADTPPPRDVGKPRLPIDRAFTLRGIGTIVTGTLTGGRLRRGQSVVLQPSGQTARIRSIQSHNQALDEAEPGTRTALSLSDVALALSAGLAPNSVGVQRGQMVTSPELGSPADALDVHLKRSSRIKLANGAAVFPLKDGSRVRIHHGTSNTTARVLLLDQNELAPGGAALAQLRLEHPIWALAGDRFIVRDWTERATLAGGVVLDPEANRRNFRRPAQQAFLRKRADAPHNVVVALETQLQRDRTGRLSELLTRSNFSSHEISAALAQAQVAGQIVVLEDWAMEASWWTGLRTQAANIIDTHHRTHPEERGLPLSQLRSSLASELPVSEVCDALLSDLCQAGFIQETSLIRRQAHRPALPAHLQVAGTLLRAALSAKPLDPPGRKDLTALAAAQQVLRFLVQSGEAIELGPDIVLLATQFSQTADVVRVFLREHHRATVSELRQAIGASRRIVVPLLEKLDRDGVTRREGDVRVLRPPC